MQQPRDSSQQPASPRGVPCGREKVRLSRTALASSQGLNKETGGGGSCPPGARLLFKRTHTALPIPKPHAALKQRSRDCLAVSGLPRALPRRGGQGWAPCQGCGPQAASDTRVFPRPLDPESSTRLGVPGRLRLGVTTGLVPWPECVPCLGRGSGLLQAGSLCPWFPQGRVTPAVFSLGHSPGLGGGACLLLLRLSVKSLPSVWVPGAPSSSAGAPQPPQCCLDAASRTLLHTCPDPPCHRTF